MRNADKAFRETGRRTGVRLRAFASRCFGARAMAYVIDPVIADLQAEYEEALGDGKRWRSRWVWVAGHVALVKAIFCYGALSTLRALGEATDDGRALRRTAACNLVVAALVCVVIIGSYARSLASLDHSSRTGVAFLLLPAAIPVALPAGLLVGVVWGMERSRRSWRARAVVLLLAAVWSAVSFVTLAWVTPETNQAFRVAVFAASIPKERSLATPPTKGAHELTLGELRRIGAGERVATLATFDDVRREYHNRWAIAATPVAFALFALALADRGWRRRLALPCACVVMVGYWLLHGAFGEGAPPAAAAWTPNLVLLGASFALRGLQSPNTPGRPASACRFAILYNEPVPWLQDRSCQRRPSPVAWRLPRSWRAPVRRRARRRGLTRATPLKGTGSSIEPLPPG